jgi:NCAIR mutase (PurE)-related protein
MSNHFEHDWSRKQRLGFPEVIFGASKTLSDLLNILTLFSEKGQNALVTKLQPEKAHELKKHFSGTFYDETSGILMLQQPKLLKDLKEIAILSAGTSDSSVVNEAFYTLSFLNVSARRFSDIGIAGLHRLTDKLDQIKSYKVLIVVAGFEGLLPSVVGGLLPQPIIAVPTSVGYGVAKDGKAALYSMLASCANGITVTNIDNGYGAAMAAFRIINQMRK